MFGAVLCCAAGLLVGHLLASLFQPKLRLLAVLALAAMHAAPSYAGCGYGVVAPAASFQAQQIYPAVVVPQAAQVIAPAPVVYQLPPLQAVVQPSYGVVAQAGVFQQQQAYGVQAAVVAPQRQVQRQVSRAARARVILPRRGVSVQKQVSRQR